MTAAYAPLYEVLAHEYQELLEESDLTVKITFLESILLLRLTADFLDNQLSISNCLNRKIML